MKRIKKIASLLLAMVMVLAMAVPTMASSGSEKVPTGYSGSFTITIDSAWDGYQYEAYQIFSGDYAEVGPAEKPTERILSNIKWGSGVDTTNEEELLGKIKGLGDAFKDVKSAEDVAEALGKAAGVDFDAEITQKFADIISGYLKKDSVAKSSAAVKAADDSYQYTINGLAPGYYLVKDVDGSVKEDGSYTEFILKVVDDVTATPKMDVPTVEKKVKENVKYGGAYNDVADYNIGDNVPFAFNSKVPDMTYYEDYTFTFHDKMAAGLTFNDDVKVTIGGVELTKDTDYTVIKPGKDNCTFEISISLKAKGKNLYDSDKEIRVEYTAKLNENAEIGLPGNENKVQLEYTNNPNGEGTGKTKEDKVIVFTYQLDVNKVDGQDHEILLDDAQFILYKQVDSKTLYAVLDTSNKIEKWTETRAEATTLASKEGKFSIIGLDDGTYYLEETKAPAGYNLLKDPVEFIIKAGTNNGQNWSEDPKDALPEEPTDPNGGDMNFYIEVGGKQEEGNLESGSVSTTIENNKGTQLPETGGIGTTIFYVVGGLLVVGAGVLLITKKRMSKEV